MHKIEAARSWNANRFAKEGLIEQGIYKGEVLQKLAGVSFIAGAILLAVFGALHPSEDLEDMSSVIQTIADSNGGFWEIDHILIGLSFWALTIGVVGVYRSISSGGAAAWARLGFYGMLAGTTIRSVFLAIDGVGLAAVVEQWERATGADKATIFVVFSSLEDVQDGMRSMTDIVTGLALVLLGIGMALSTVYPRWLGWSIIVVGAGWTVVGFVIGIAGLSDALIAPLFVVFVSTVLWALVMGIVITRKERQAV